MISGLNNNVLNMNLAARSTGDLKTMRLAQSVTAEYSNYFGATSASQVSLVLAAINNTLTRCNVRHLRDGGIQSLSARYRCPIVVIMLKLQKMLIDFGQAQNCRPVMVCC